MVDKSNARVRRMFSRIATRYDLLNHLLSLNVDRYWRWRTVRRVPPTAGPPVLDVCTGTGDLALAYLKAARYTPHAAVAVGAREAYLGDTADSLRQKVFNFRSKRLMKARQREAMDQQWDAMSGGRR